MGEAYQKQLRKNWGIMGYRILSSTIEDLNDDERAVLKAILKMEGLETHIIT